MGQVAISLTGIAGELAGYARQANGHLAHGNLNGSFGNVGAVVIVAAGCQ
jgi:hypothetical protein